MNPISTAAQRRGPLRVGGVGIAAAISAAGLGTFLGLVAGFTNRWVDTVIMRVVDIFLSFPSLIVILLIVAVLGPSVTTIVVVIAFFAFYKIGGKPAGLALWRLFGTPV